MAGEWQFFDNNIHCLNNRGEVIAQQDVGRLDGADSVGDDHTFLWSRGRWHDVGDLPQYHNVQGTALNNRGQVVGSLIGPQQNDTPGAITREGFLWEGGAVQCLRNLPAYSESEPLAVSDSGEIVGDTFNVYMFSPDYAPPTHAFLYRHGRMILLAGAGSDAADINNRGQIVGNDNSRIFLWQNGKKVIIDTAGGAVAIYDETQVLIQYGGSSAERGRLWQDGKTQDIGTLPGLPLMTVKALNDAGEIVGQASNGNVNRAFLWQNGRMRDISHLQPGWTLTEAYGINNRGQVVGVGTYRGDEHDFLLTPR